MTALAQVEAQVQAPAPDGWRSYMAAQADTLDEGPAPFDLIAYLAEQGLTQVGVPRHLGGDGAPKSQVVEAIAALAEESLTAAFVLWGHRCFIEYVVQSDNPAVPEQALPDLLAGRWAGATGMSNAMKHLGGIESLQIKATALPAQEGSGWQINGALPWVTHLRRSGFSVAAAVEVTDAASVPVFAFHSQQSGVLRSDDLPLLGLRASDTAAIELRDVYASHADRLHADLRAWLPQIRPSFLANQCALSVGLARVSLMAAKQRLATRNVLRATLLQLEEQLESSTAQLLQGLDEGRFASEPAVLFRLRIALAEQAQQAVALELQAAGGQAYLLDHGAGFARRWREAAFVPIVTPSLTQLKAQLEQHAA